jgi:cyclopropane fatty-acyl-phospholipid synthase-like methyltransferase
MSAPTPYDRLPYDSFPFAQTHPAHLCALARLHGVNAPDPRNARVLEIGCASGGNLIPMAEQLPFASFVGLDLSARQISMAKSAAAEANVHNVTFTHANVATYDGAGQHYDYIIAHGVYSWMPETARDAQMQVCEQCLTDTGIAYISYNTYPGWHLRGAIRDMMMYHASGFESDAQQVQQARSLLNFLQENAATGADAYSLLLEREATILANSADAYIRHEHLSGDNVPLYFHQFATKAAGFSLKFLAEAELSSHSTANLTDAAKEAIDSLCQDVIRREQYLDFLRNRTFRQSLLVQDGVPTLPSAQAPLLDSLALSANLTRTSQDEVQQSFTFSAQNGTSLATSDPLLTAALTELLNRKPDRLSAHALVNSAADEAQRESGFPLSRDLPSRLERRDRTAAPPRLRTYRATDGYSAERVPGMGALSPS